MFEDNDKEIALIVDDNAVNRLLIRRLLEGRDWNMFDVDSGEKALEWLEKGYIPDLIFLDISMPGISGVDLCQILRNHEKWQNLQIIAYTAHAMPNETDLLLSQGFDALLIKPVTVSSVMGSIENAKNSARRRQLAF